MAERSIITDIIRIQPIVRSIVADIGPAENALLLESGDFLLKEDGGFLLLEA